MKLTSEELKELAARLKLIREQAYVEDKWVDYETLTLTDVPPVGDGWNKNYPDSDRTNEDYQGWT